MFIRRIFLSIIVLCLAAPVWSTNLPSPSGRVVLTVSGEIAHKNQGDVAAFDQDMLEALEWQTIETFTYYTEGLQRFSGPTLASLLAELDITDGVLRAVALDDYSVDIPVSDLQEHEILLAVRHNDVKMRVRDRGPIWIIYPADSVGDIGDSHMRRSIWQLKHIQVRR